MHRPLNHFDTAFSVPPEIGLLTRLEHISFADNDLEGYVPSEIGLLNELKNLDLSGNPKLEGTLPAEVRNLPSLTEIKADLP